MSKSHRFFCPSCGIALLTTGWNGFVLASPWTLAVAGLALLTGWLTRPDGE
ncbi:MAG: hypothetical protein V8Q30_13450 [Acutalibacteraceae bacterium]